MVQKGFMGIEKVRQSWDMRVYYKEELERLISIAGFEVLTNESESWQTQSSNFIVARKL